MDHTAPHVLDAWIGYHIYKSDREQEAIDGAKSGGKMSMEDAGQHLQNSYGSVQ